MIIKNICPNCFYEKEREDMPCVQCGYVHAPKKDNKVLPVGCILKSRYCIGRVLGQGGFGITYLAYDNQYQNLRAIKEYYPRVWGERQQDGLTISPQDAHTQKAYWHGLDKFVEEARNLQAFHESRVIVDVVDFFRENSTAYIAMEYIPGMTLSRYIRHQNGPLPIEMASRIICDVGESITMVHKKGMLHRDISPDNLILQSDGSIKIIDFGATRHFVLNETNDMSVVLKMGFSPLEQYSKTGKHGPWSDVYSLAATYYYLVTGKKPLPAGECFGGRKQTPLHQLNNQVPESVSKVIDKAMDMDYRKRYQSMDDFVEALRKEAFPQKNEKKMPHIYSWIGGMFRKYKFNFDKSIRIGRSPQCDICINSMEISRVHCEILYDVSSECFVVRDYSANGTYSVNGLIGKGNSIYVQSGGYIYLVNMSNQVRLEVK